MSFDLQDFIDNPSYNLPRHSEVQAMRISGQRFPHTAENSALSQAMHHKLDFDTFEKIAAALDWPWDWWPILQCKSVGKHRGLCHLLI